MALWATTALAQPGEGPRGADTSDADDFARPVEAQPPAAVYPDESSDTYPNDHGDGTEATAPDHEAASGGGAAPATPPAAEQYVGEPYSDEQSFEFGWDDSGGGLEEAFVPGHGAPRFWLPEVHCGCGGVCDECRDPWFTNAELVLLHRNRSQDVVTTLETDFFDFGFPQLTPIDLPIMNTNAGTFHFEPGMRITVGRYLGKDYIGRDHTLEFTYLGVPEWKASRFKTGARIGPVEIGGFDFDFGQLNSPFSQNGQSIGSFAGGFSNADYHGYEMRSELHNFELNWRVRRGERRPSLVAAPDGSWTEDYTPSATPAVLLGLRYLDFRDDFTWNSRGIVEQDDDRQPFSGQYNVDTTSHFLGLQAGIELRNQWRRFSWTVGIKAGLYGTSLDQNSAILLDDDTLLHQGVYPSENQTFGDDALSVGFIGELGLLMRYRLTPYLTLRGGYDFMWVNGLALAPEQLTFTNPPVAKVDANGHLLFQGATIGFEAVW